VDEDPPKLFPVDIFDVGFACACLPTPLGQRLSGETLYADGGFNFVA